MLGEPYTIRIFVPDGDPEGVRIVDRFNWTGKGIVFPRSKWPETKSREEFGNPGVYILVGLDSDDEDLPKVYIGEGDGIRERVDSHYKNKDFWSWGIAFISTNRGLNKAHIQWLEYALVQQAMKVDQCHLDNENTPQEPGLTESEKADTRGFLKEVLQILPLAGLRAFELPRSAPATHLGSRESEPDASVEEEIDTVVVPSTPEGFKKVFLGEDRWYAIRIGQVTIPKIKWIAVYQKSPVSAVTHVARVARIEPHGEEGKFQLIFAEPAKKLDRPILGGASGTYMQGRRYTTYKKLLKATKLMDLFD